MARLRRLILIALFGLLPCSWALSQGQTPLAHLDNATFNRPSGKPFTEIYLQIPAKKLNFTKFQDSGYFAKANIKIQLKKQESTFHEQSFTLTSPRVLDTQDLHFYLRDQVTVPLEKSTAYELMVIVQDSLQPQKLARTKREFNTNFPDQSVSFSDIKLVDSVFLTRHDNRFSRRKYTMIPQAKPMISKEKNQFAFFSEVYHTDKRQNPSKIIISLIHNGDTLVTQKETIQPKPVIPILAKLKTKALKDGQHKLLIKATDEKENTLSMTSMRFQTFSKADKVRLQDSLKYYSRDSLETFVEWHSPIADKKEMPQIEKFTNKTVPEDSLTHFIADFWQERYPEAVLQSWRTYKRWVHIVNQNYATTITPGYETDRGRVYLQYGPPNNIIESMDDPNTYAYEIWRYNRTERQANVKFVFYSNSIMEREFVILHSNAFGEYNNPDWQEELNRNPYPNNSPWGNDPGWDYNK